MGTFIAFPQFNFELFGEGIGNFGRSCSLHTSAVIFAFGGNALIASSFYVVQRTCVARLWPVGGNLAWFVFWGYHLLIILAAKFPMYVVRALSGVLYLAGGVIMARNVDGGAEGHRGNGTSRQARD